MKKYIILKNNIEDLEAMVNEHIAKGYTPHGSLLIAASGGYIQAMAFSPMPIFYSQDVTESKPTKTTKK
jgi:hypothetical protein